MKKIKLTKGRYTFVDDADYEELSRHKWCFHETGRGYAIRRLPRKSGGKTLLMHRAIMKAPAHLEVDHIDGDSLDNRRSNLRLCTHAQNRLNTRKHKDNTSGLKGVHWHKAAKKWGARHRNKHLGLFITREAAAEAYNLAAQKAADEFFFPSSPA